MPITSVFLDAGGVIVDETNEYATYAEAAVEIIAEKVRGYSAERYWLDFEEANLRLSPFIRQYIVYKYARSRGEFDETYARINELARLRLGPIVITPGIADQIRELSTDLRIGIAGQYGRSLIEALEREGLLMHFCWTYTQDDFALTKPDPRYFEQILSRCGAVAAESIMVGDRIDNDIVPARRVGMRTIRMRNGAHASQTPTIPLEVADLEIERIDELATAVRKLAVTFD